MADINELTRVYIKIRDARGAAKAEWEEKDKALKRDLERIEAVLMRFLNDTGQKHAATSSGTVARIEKITPTGADWSAFYAWVKEHDAFEFLERRITMKPVKQYMETHNGGIPPGVSVFRTYGVKVTRS